MRRQSCLIGYSEELGATLTRTVGGSSWGQSAQVQRHALAPKQEVADIVSPDNERYVLTASYSMSPDYSSLITSVNASAYSSRLANAPKKWQKNAAWSDELVVVSDRTTIAPKSQADIDAAVTAEEARYKALPLADLVRKANAGDANARSQAAKMIAAHKRALKLARAEAWTPASEAEQRSRLWAANGCEKLRQALASNTSEVEAMLGQLFRGELPARVNDVPKQPLPVVAGGERQVRAEPVGVYRMARGSEDVTLAYRYAWLPEPEAE